MPKNHEVQPAQPSWEAGPDATLADALSVGQDVFMDVVKALPTLPRKDLTRHYPATMADAVALVHSREDLKKKNAASKAAYRSRRPGTAPPSPKKEYYQGSKPGGKEPSAFWMYTEDFFRDVTQEDLRDILSHYSVDPEKDPAFNIPTCGSSVLTMAENRAIAHTTTAAGGGGGPRTGPSPAARRLPPPPPSFARGPSAPPAFAHPSPSQQQQQQQHPASAMPVLSIGQATDTSTEKRSSRLAAKAANKRGGPASFGDWEEHGTAMGDLPPSAADTTNLIGQREQNENGITDDDAGIGAQQQQQQGQAGARVGSPAIMMPPPPPMSTRSVATAHIMYTPDVGAGLGGEDGGAAGRPPTLLETLPDSTLAQLAIQLTELMHCAHIKEGKSKSSSSGKGLDKALLHACKECLSSKKDKLKNTTSSNSKDKGKKGGSNKQNYSTKDTIDGKGEDGVAYLESEHRVEIESWLVKQSTTLSKMFGASIDTMPPFWLPLSNPVYIADKKQDGDVGAIQQQQQQQQQQREEGEKDKDKEKTADAPPPSTTTRGRRSAGKDENNKKSKAGTKSTPASASQPASPSNPPAAAPTVSFAEPVPFPRAGKVHPYTKMVLQGKVPDHVIEAATEVILHIEQSNAANAPSLQQQPTTSGGVVTEKVTKTPRTGSAAAGEDAPINNNHIAQQDTATTTTTSAPLNGDALDVDGEEEDLNATTMDTDGAGDDDGAAVARSARARAKSQLNYAILAGTRKNPPRPPSAQGKNKQKGSGPTGAVGGGGATPGQDGGIGEGGPMHPVAAAVAAFIEEAEDSVVKPTLPPGSIDPRLLAAVPQDEVTAEMVALQAELATVMAVNRARLLAALKAALQDLPRQAEERTLKAKEEADVAAWVKELQAIKQEQNKELQAAALREEMAQKQLAIVNSPHPVLGQRSGGGFAEDGTPLPPVGDGPILSREELYDVLAQRKPEDEAFCAVCGDGHSEAPNEIIFCERCDVAVHQKCYDVSVVPEGEWLCWPCALFEEDERMRGKTQHDIRPPRWHTMQHEPMDGGARDVKCALCPIKYGAFRQTADRTRWVHQACAMWTPELYLRPGEGPAVVDGLGNVKSERMELTCVVCGVKDGAPVQCAHGQCQHAFHVLCARNVGLYLAARNDSQGRPQFKVYCAVHGPVQQEKDLKILAAKVGQAGPSAGSGAGAGGPRRPGRPPGSGGGAGAGRGRRPDPLAPAKRALDIRLQERVLLDIARVNLEQCRMLVDQCKRRERMKRQKIMLDKQIHDERMLNPAQSLEYLQRKQQWMSAGGNGNDSESIVPSFAGSAIPSPPQQQAPAALGPGILAGHPLHYHYHPGGVPPVPPPSGVKINLVSHGPGTIGGGIVPPHMAVPPIIPPMPPPHTIGGTGGMLATPAGFQQQQQQQQPEQRSAINETADGGNPNSGGALRRSSARRGAAAAAATAAVVETAVDPIAGYDWNRAAQRVMSSRQLAEAQGQLPPSVKYFPIEDLLSGKGIKKMTAAQQQEQVELHQLAQQQQAEVHQQQMDAQKQQRQRQRGQQRQQQYLDEYEEEDEEEEEELDPSDEDFNAPAVLDGSPLLERKMTRRRGSR